MTRYWNNENVHKIRFLLENERASASVHRKMSAPLCHGRCCCVFYPKYVFIYRVEEIACIERTYSLLALLQSLSSPSCVCICACDSRSFHSHTMRIYIAFIALDGWLCVASLLVLIVYIYIYISWSRHDCVVHTVSVEPTMKKKPCFIFVTTSQTGIYESAYSRYMLTMLCLLSPHSRFTFSTPSADIVPPNAIQRNPCNIYKQHTMVCINCG